MKFTESVIQTYHPKPNAPHHETNASSQIKKDTKYAIPIKKYANQNTKYAIPIKRIRLPKRHAISTVLKAL